MATPTELSGRLNQAVKAWQRLNLQQRFSETEGTRQLQEELGHSSDLVQAWLRDATLQASEARYTTEDLCADYNRYANSHGESPIGVSQFGRRLQKLRPGLKRVQATLPNRARIRYVTGLTLKGVAPSPALAA